MKQNHFAEFDKIISDRKKKLKAFSSKYRVLKSEAEKQIAETFYGKESLYLGYYCPSLIIDKISNFKRGKIKNKLSGNAKKYVSYEIDKKGTLLRMKEVNQFGTVVETYVIRDKNETFSISFLESELDSSTETVRAIYNDDGNLTRCDFISDVSLRSEVYTYNEKNNNRIKCIQYYYVPELSGSDKSKKPGEADSPARLFEIDIVTTDNKEIQRLEYGEVMNGKREISFVYEKDK